MAKQFFVLRVLSEREEGAKVKLEDKIRHSACKDKFGRILIPIEHVSEVKGGKKRVTKRKIYPGYLLVEMDLDDDTSTLIMEMRGTISGFVGTDRQKPRPLPDSDMVRILSSMDEQKDKPKPKVEFEIGENVKVIEGAFESYDGTVEEVFPEKGVLKVSVSIFGRRTPVELEYWQVERI
jgi:transcription termination/antitermination protein NusG